MLKFWNTCKRLSNPERVDMLRVVMKADADFGISVGDISEIVKLKVASVSTYLTELKDECGLVRSSRDGRYVIYYPWTDGPEAELVDALRKYFLGEHRDKVWVNGRRPPAPDFVFVLPALANDTRQWVVEYIRKERKTTLDHIMHALNLTDNNARRHVRIIAESGLCKFDKEISWLEPEDSMIKLFLERALTGASLAG